MREVRLKRPKIPEEILSRSIFRSFFLIISALDPQDFGFLDPDPQKYADPRIRIHGVKYQPKTAKKKLFHS